MLSACSDKSSERIPDTGIVPYITTMPTLTSTEPPDTYEQYRATYTPTGTPKNSPFTILGVAADTAASPPVMGTVTAVPGESDRNVSAPETVVPSADTAAFTESSTGPTAASDEKNTSGTSASESGSISSSSASSTWSVTAPSADTAVSNNVNADTSPTDTAEETSANENTSNGGT